MQLAAIIVYLSHIVWSLPPFRQYKGNFFNYFLIIAIGDPFGTFLIRLGYRNSFSVYLLVVAATLLALIAINNKINRILATALILFALAAGILLPPSSTQILIAAFLLVLIYYFIHYMMIFVSKHGRVSLFHILLLVYNVSLVFKFVNIALELQKGAVYFYFTTVFEIILGVLFCIFREDDKRLALRLKEPETDTSLLEAEFVARENEV